MVVAGGPKVRRRKRNLPTDACAQSELRRCHAQCSRSYNIEVIYDHVILVLKGVSTRGAGRRHRRRFSAATGWRARSTTVEGDREPGLRGRARRSDKGSSIAFAGERMRWRSTPRPSSSGRPDPGHGGAPLALRHAITVEENL